MSANIKASVDGTQAIIGVGGVDQMTVSNAGVVTANSFVGLNNSSVTATGSTTARTLANRFADVVNVLDFGAHSITEAGYETFDSTTAIQNAINSLNDGGTVVIPANTYRINSTINMKSNVTVQCEFGVIINGENVASGDLITFTGSVGSEFLFSEARTRGDTTIKLSGSPGFSVGDIIHLVSYKSVFDPGTYNLGNSATDNCYYSEWNIIAQDLGGGLYRLAIPFEFPDWTTISKAKKVTPCKNANWIGGTLNRTSSGNAGDSIFASSWAYECSVRDVETYRGSRPGWTIEWMESWRCEASRITNNNDPTLLFNYDIDHANLNRFKTVGSQDCGFIDLKESFGTQSVDFTYSSSQAPYSNIRSYCRNGFFYRCFEGLTSHPGVYQDQWIGNTITDCGDDGFVLRGYMPTIQGNIITSTVDITDSLVFTAGSFVIGRRYRITTLGDTNFTLIGASANTVGIYFVATGIGSGTGTATQVDTYGIRLGYGGARRADISNNVISGFYGAISIYGSTTLGEWTNIICNIHDNEIRNCFIGLSTIGIGETNDFRFITYQSNRHSAMGRYIVYFPEYVAGCTIKDNVLDGSFRYDGIGTDVAFIYAVGNCPAITISGNQWNRPKGTNNGKTKYFTFIGSISDLVKFPKSDWAALTVLENNYSTFVNDALFVYYNISSTNYVQFNSLLPLYYSSIISSGVAEVISSLSRTSYLQVETEGSSASDDLDIVDPYTNCFVQEGDVLYIRSTSSARDVIIRDINTSGATINGFQTPLNASITLGTSNDIVMCIHNGTHWLVASQSLNG